jgi:hypothetical protein
MRPMTALFRQPHEARTRPRWLPAAAVLSALACVIFAVWAFSTLAT